MSASMEESTISIVYGSDVGVYDKIADQGRESDVSVPEQKQKLTSESGSYKKKKGCWGKTGCSVLTLLCSIPNPADTVCVEAPCPSLVIGTEQQKREHEQRRLIKNALLF